MSRYITYRRGRELINIPDQGYRIVRGSDLWPLLCPTDPRQADPDPADDIVEVSASA
jgi:hypothetical protein